MARDNFTKAVIEKLQKRVANRCSNPDCRVPTIGPASNPDKATSIGIAAHITAASSGGPRYDDSLTDRQRKSMENGIWLCSNCSIAIDKDVDRHPVELLKEWKQQAEAFARQEIGKKLPGANDAVEMLTTALTGKSNRLIADAIQNTHKASALALESLDPRFSISSAYVNGTAHFEIRPKEDVSLTIKINGESAQEYFEKIKKLIEHGTELVIDSDSITIEGSKLFDEIGARSLKKSLKLIPNQIKATQKIWLINKKTSIIESFDDIHGQVSIGRQSFTFKGSACDGIFHFEYQKNISDGQTSARVFVRINFDRWSGVDVRALPYFNKLHSFFLKLEEGWHFNTSLEINGTEALRSKDILVNASFYRELLNQLNVIKMAISIAKALDIHIAFNPNYKFTEQEFSDFYDASSIANGTHVFFKNDIQDNMKGSFTVENNNFAALLKVQEPVDFTIISHEESELQVFGQQIKLPPIVMKIKAATPCITSIKPLEELTNGDQIQVEWIPSDNFEYRIEFDKKQLG